MSINEEIISVEGTKVEEWREETEFVVGLLVVGLFVVGENVVG